MKTSRRRNRPPGGFTLIEVLLVLVILVILVSLVAGGYISAQRRAMTDAARAQIGLFKTPLTMYHLSLFTYPSTQQGLEALLNPPSDLGNANKWDGPYLEESVPVDPWGNPYQYESPGKYNTETYDIWSFGPDQSDGTNDDIGNWEQEQ